MCVLKKRTSLKSAPTDVDKELWRETGQMERFWRNVLNLSNQHVAPFWCAYPVQIWLFFSLTVYIWIVLQIAWRFLHSREETEQCSLAKTSSSTRHAGLLGAVGRQVIGSGDIWGGKSVRANRGWLKQSGHTERWRGWLLQNNKIYTKWTTITESGGWRRSIRQPRGQDAREECV